MRSTAFFLAALFGAFPAFADGLSGSGCGPGSACTPGSVVVGAPMGGNQGAGTINATGVFVNGVAVSTGGNVSNSGSPSANQIGVWVTSTTIQGVSLSTLLATPPTIGGTTPAAGAFTTLSAAGNFAVTGSSFNVKAYPATAEGCAFASGTCGFAVVGTTDPTLGSGSGSDRWFGVSMTLNASTATANNIWENFHSELTANGPNNYTREINMNDTDLTVASGTTVSLAEGYESRLDVNGAITNYSSFLSLPVVNAGGTAGTIIGGKFFLTNTSPTPGNVTNYVGLYFGSLGGGGTVPTNQWAIQNVDPLQIIATAGQLLVGGIGTLPSTQVVLINGPDTSGSTSAFAVKNSAATSLMNVLDNNTVLFGQTVKIGVGTTAGVIFLQSGTSGEGVNLISGTGAASSTPNITIPQSAGATTLAALAATQTFSAVNTFSGGFVSTGSFSASKGVLEVLGYIHSADMNSTADQAFTMISSMPAAYLLSSISVTNCSSTPATAVGGIYTATSKGGTAIVAATQDYTALTTTAAVKALTIQAASLTTSGRITAAQLYFSLTTPEGGASTCDVFVSGTGLP